MRMTLSLAALFLTACATVPTQLKTAIDVQEREIANVKEMYRVNVSNLLDSIEKYQIAFIDLHEARFIAKESKALDEVAGVVKEVDPTGDPDIDYVKLSMLKDIQDFFDAKRNEVRQDIRQRRAEFNKIEANFENIEAINRAVADYIDSLARLSNARTAAAQGLFNKIDGLSPIPISLDDLPDPSSIENVLDTFTPGSD